MATRHTTLKNTCSKYDASQVSCNRISDANEHHTSEATEARAEMSKQVGYVQAPILYDNKPTTTFVTQLPTCYITHNYPYICQTLCQTVEFKRVFVYVLALVVVVSLKVARFMFPNACLFVLDN